MKEFSVPWRVTIDAKNNQVYPILMQDPVWNSFGLADLEPPWRDYSQFAIAANDDNDEQALCLVVRHPVIGQVLSPFGARDGIAAILNQIVLPNHPLIQAQELHSSLLQRYYQPTSSWKRMLRMAITSASWRPSIDVSLPTVKLLTISDIPSLRQLYNQHLGSMFSVELFDQGLYIGAYEGERLVAAGGTRVLAPTSQIAVLGDIFTAPDVRGRGYATTVTAALVRTLFEQRFSTIVLNVFEDNDSAVRIYHRLGFQTHHKLLTGKAHFK